MRKSAVKFDQMPGKYEKKRAFFAQRDASDFVQQNEGDNMIPRLNQETNENEKKVNATAKSNTTKLANQTKISNLTSNFVATANISVSQTVKNATTVAPPVTAPVKAVANTTVSSVSNTTSLNK